MNLSEPLSVLAAAAWLADILLALARRVESALLWYAGLGALEAAAAVRVGLATHIPGWFVLAAVWAVTKGVLVPVVLRRTYPRDLYGLRAAGTPRLVGVAAILLAVLLWVDGRVGVLLALLATPLWFVIERRDVWAQGLALLATEIGVGFLLLARGGAPGTTEVWAAVELLLTAVLIGWLHARGRQAYPAGPTSDDLTLLRG